MQNIADVMGSCSCCYARFRLAITVFAKRSND